MNRRKPIRRPEQMLQRACVQLLEAFYEPMPDVFWTAINPVPAKSKAVAGISKAMGLKPGVFDMMFITQSIDHCVRFIEFKAPEGRLSDHQKALIEQFEGFQPPVRVHVITKIEQFVEALKKWGIHPRRKLTLRSGSHIAADEYLTNHL